MKRIHRYRRHAAMALLALLVPSLLAACGGSSAATDTPAPTKAAATTGAAPTTAAGAPTTAAAAPTTAAPSAAAATSAASPAAAGGTAAAGAKSGGQLVIGRNTDDLITLDPGHFYEVSSEQIMGAAYDPLVGQDAQDLSKFTPMLATEVPTIQNGGISADGKTYTFKLRDNVKFHTGGTMTADDVVFSMKRLHFLQDNPSFLTDPFSTKDAVNVTAVDKLTVKFTLSEPNVAFLTYVATPNLSPSDSKAVKDKGGTDAATAKDSDKAKDYLDQNSVGTGPYILKSFKQKEEVVLDRNPNYWRAPAKLDRIILKYIQKTGPERQQLEAGTIDVAQELDADAVADLQKSGQYTVVTGNTLNLAYLALHNSTEVGGPLANKQVRQAIAYAVDYKGIIEGLKKNAAVRPATIIPLGLLGAKEAQQFTINTDVNKAKDLMKQAGAVGQSIKLFYGAGTTVEGVDAETLAAKLKADIEQTGLKVELTPTDFTQHLTNYRASKEQSVLITWGPDYADANDYAGTFGRTGQAPAKRIGYSNPAVDALVDQAAKELDVAKRTDLYVQAQKIIVDDTPFVVLFQPVAQEVMKKTVTGYTYHPVLLVDYYNLAKTG